MLFNGGLGLHQQTYIGTTLKAHTALKEIIAQNHTSFLPAFPSMAMHKRFDFLLFVGKCRQRTTSGYCCVFPFIYRGRRYNSCARTRRGRAWCPITPDYRRGRQWSYCRGKRGNIEFIHWVLRLRNPRLT